MTFLSPVTDKLPVISRLPVHPTSPKFLTSRLTAALVLLAAMQFVAACATAPDRVVDSYAFSKDAASTGHFQRWFEGSSDLVVDPVGQLTVEDRLMAGELAYWKGDVEQAFGIYVAMLQEVPGHALNRFAAARLYDIHGEVVDFHARIQPVLEGVSYAGESPMTRMYLALLGQATALDLWRKSDSDQPFSGDAYGLPTRWMASPMMSPWRLLDFNTPFEPDGEPHLAATYRSPQAALERKANTERTQPYMATGVTLSPRLGTAGVYYMETFLTVDATREYWVYGNFPLAAVMWIGDEEILRREEDYGAAKRYRRVRLEAGTHRVRVKLAYQPRYRDWFDLVFIHDGAGPMGGSGVTSSMGPPPGFTAAAKAQALTQTYLPSMLEPVMVPAERVAAADDISLYFTAVAAFQNGQAEYFEPAWQELMARHEGFGAGYALKSAQVQTLWQMPTELREAAALGNLRKAYSQDPESLHVLSRLGSMLRRRGSDREVREILETARDGALRSEDSPTSGALRNAEPLGAWASYLEGKGWSWAAEKAWRHLLELAPAHCGAATSLQRIYYGRSYYPDLEAITPRWQDCPVLERRLIVDQPARAHERLQYLEREAKRHPYGSDHQLRLARALVSQGEPEKAREVLRQALELQPDVLSLWSELADYALLDTEYPGGKAAASKILEQAQELNGNNGWLLWRKAVLDGRVPLQDIMPDGLAAARAEMRAETRAGAAESEELEQVRQGDEAYYVVDFAARQLFPDGTSLTLTHTVVRVMTRGAIDRFGETQIPESAQLLVARTIKQDGSTRAPEEVAGKASLSMPGLAEGDFVEIAYLEYAAKPAVPSHLEDIRFFFRMGDISTLHSEYVILGVEDDLEFMLENSPPQAEAIELLGQRGVRFLAKNNPRPRSEPHSVSGYEYLPWVQAYRSGVTMEILDADRRFVTELILDSLKPSAELREQAWRWLDREAKDAGKLGEADVRRLFYGVSQWISLPAQTSFATDASHVLQTRRGSALILLKAAYDAVGIDSDVYLIKSKAQIPAAYPIGEFAKYQQALLRVRIPGTTESIWLDPNGPDAMYGAVDAALVGQPALCVSCSDLVRDQVDPTPVHAPSRHILVEASLGRDGTLLGSTTHTFTGPRAMAVRAALRARPDESNRQKYMEALLADVIPGSTLNSFSVDREREPDTTLLVHMDFERPQFARAVSDGGNGDTWLVETTIFREALARIYTPLSTRNLDLFAGYERTNDYELRLSLPPSHNAELRSRAGDWTLASSFGEFERSVILEDNTLQIRSRVHVPIQRISADNYAQFQTWANEVEESGVLFLRLN